MSDSLIVCGGVLTLPVVVVEVHIALAILDLPVEDPKGGCFNVDVLPFLLMLKDFSLPVTLNVCNF